MIKNWNEAQRDDLKLIPTMEKLGFKPTFSYRDKMHKRITPENCPHDAVGFQRDNFVVWKAYKTMSEGSFSYWQTAILKEGHYTDHKPYNTAEEMLADIS